jgi:hypothetical protein
MKPVLFLNQNYISTQLKKSKERKSQTNFLMNIDKKIAIKYLQRKFNSTCKKGHILQLISFQAHKDGLTYIFNKHDAAHRMNQGQNLHEHLNRCKNSSTKLSTSS